VLEEEQELRDTIASMLEVDGYDVLAARGEKEAALQADDSPVDLILAGIYQSENETIDEARRIRARIGCGSETPIVIFSATSLEEGQELVIPGRVYLIRPDNFDHLRVLLRRLVAD
jgi:DNA-binding response OmpR family regulator